MHMYVCSVSVYTCFRRAFSHLLTVPTNCKLCRSIALTTMAIKFLTKPVYYRIASTLVDRAQGTFPEKNFAVHEA